MGHCEQEQQEAKKNAGKAIVACDPDFAEMDFVRLGAPPGNHAVFFSFLQRHCCAILLVCTIDLGLDPTAQDPAWRSRFHSSSVANIHILSYERHMMNGFVLSIQSSSLQYRCDFYSFSFGIYSEVYSEIYSEIYSEDPTCFPATGIDFCI